MTHFHRSGHRRSSKYGTVHWVSSHSVSRSGYGVSSRRDELERAGRTACFVNPNAQCPVCGASIFYYQNKWGSRVFFDELGWPWPKHQCTDSNLRFQLIADLPSERSEYEKAATLKEIASVGLDLDKVFADRFGQSPWHLAKAVKCFRNGKFNLIAAENLESSRRLYFQFESNKRDLRAGDIFAKKGARVTFLDRGLLEPCEKRVTAIKKVSDFIDRIPTK